MNKKKLIFWIILGLVVVGIVLAILFVTLLGPKDTRALAESVNNYTTGDGYLNSSSERNKKLDDYFDKTYTLFTGEEAYEIYNYKQMYTIYEGIAEFFNRETAFMTYNNTYKSKKNDVERNLNEAQKTVDELLKKIEENKDLIVGNPALEKIVWHDNKYLAKEFIEKTIEAFNNLSDIYTDCVSSSILNNNYSKANFIVMKDLSSKALKNITTQSITAKFSSFATYHFSISGENRIINFECNASSTTKEKIESIVENGAESEYYNAFVENGI